MTIRAKEAAQAFLSWAASHGLVVDAWDGLSAPNAHIGTPFGGVSPEAMGVLRKRQIRHVGSSEQPDTITVYLRRAAPTTKEMLALPNQVLGVPVVYRQGNPEAVGSAPVVAATSASPSTYRNPTTGSTHYTCGSSISLGNEVSAGTLGTLVQDATGQLYGLSNNHVVGGSGQAPLGMPVVAPGLVDVGPWSLDPTTIGRLFRAEPMHPGDPSQVIHGNNVDCAIFTIPNPNLICSLQGDSYDTPTQHLLPRTGMQVEKVGRTTGHTTGIIINEVIGPFCVPVHNQTYGYSGRVFFEPVYVVQGLSDKFSDAGDSGSLVVHLDSSTGERTAVGLVFAGMQDGTAPGGALSLILPISPILARLNLRLVSGLNL